MVVLQNGPSSYEMSLNASKLPTVMFRVLRILVVVRVLSDLSIDHLRAYIPDITRLLQGKGAGDKAGRSGVCPRSGGTAAGGASEPAGRHPSNDGLLPELCARPALPVEVSG